MSTPREPRSGGEITNVLKAAQGDPAALMELFYNEFRSIAAAKMNGLGPGHTLDPTGLVHEALLRTFKGNIPQWESSEHFFSTISLAMRNALVDHARKRLATKRGGDRVHERDGDILAESLNDMDRLTQYVDLDDALAWLESVDPDKAQIAQLRYFMGMSNTQIANIKDVSEQTVKRSWRMARAMLRSYLERDQSLNDGTPPPFEARNE